LEKRLKEIERPSRWSANIPLSYGGFLNSPRFRFSPDEVNRDQIGQEPSTGPIALSISILIFGLILIGLLTYLIKAGAIGQVPFFRLFGLSLILSTGLALIVGGWTERQIAPLMALLGTIAGYVLGKDDGHKPEPDKTRTGDGSQGFTPKVPVVKVSEEKALDVKTPETK
jgi:hypothetical protein